MIHRRQSYRLTHESGNRKTNTNAHIENKMTAALLFLGGADALLELLQPF
jgi:hypothetical protein